MEHMSDTRTQTREPAAAGEPPAGRAVVGYARADGDGAALAVLTRRLREAGCTVVHADERPGRQDDLPGLRDCLAALRPGDVLVVASLDQLGRTRPELIAAVEQVRRSGAGLRSLREDLDTTGPGGAAMPRPAPNARRRDG